MKVNEEIKEFLGEFLMDNALIHTKLVRNVVALTPPGTVIKKGKTIEETWLKAGVPAEVIDQHFKKGLRYLNANELVKQNPYYQNIKPSMTSYKDWRLSQVKFEEGEVDIVDQDFLDENYRIQLPLAIHTKRFKALSLTQKGRTWMSITPNEIFTMEKHIEAAHGRVLTAGLGLGYFTYMCALKDEVESVTVIEGNSDVIDFFKQTILPQFGEVQSKIKIIESDYYDYIDHHNIKVMYDYSFIDIHLSGAHAGDVYCLSEEVLYHYEGEGEVHYWLEEGVECKMQLGIAIGLFNKFVMNKSMEDAFNVCWGLYSPCEYSFRVMAKMCGWVYANVHTVSSVEEIKDLIFNPKRYRMLAAYTDHQQK